MLALCKKTNVHATKKYTDAYPQNWGCELHVYLKDGRCLKTIVWNGKGSSDNPLTKEDLIKKFKSLAGERLSDDHMNKIVAGIYDLDKYEDIADFTALLAK